MIMVRNVFGVQAAGERMMGTEEMLNREGVEEAVDKNIVISSSSTMVCGV